MSGQSNVGNSQVYEAGDQKNESSSDSNENRFHEGQAHSHKANDSSEFPNQSSSILKALANIPCKRIQEPSPINSLVKSR